MHAYSSLLKLALAILLFVCLPLLRWQHYPPVLAQPSAPETSTDSGDETDEVPVLIAEVVIEGADGEFEDLIYQTVQTQPGSAVTRSQVQADVEAIFATGYFSNVQAIPEDVSAGVRVTFEVLLNPVFTSVQIAGIQVLPQTVIDEAFGDQYGSVLNLRRLRVGIEQLSQWYADNSYVIARFVDEPQITDGVVAFEVAEGVIEDIQIRFQNRDFEAIDGAGTPISGYVTEADILAALAIEPGDIFHQEEMVAALEAVFALGVFEDVGLELDVGQDPRQVIVIINLFELPGAGYDESSCAQQVTAGQFQAALESCQAQLEHYQTNGDRRRESYTLGNLGLAYAGLGQPAQADEFYQQSLGLARQINDRRTEAIVLNNQGRAAHDRGQYEQANTLYQQALSIARDIGERALEEQILLNLDGLENAVE
ncbi:MAG: tetratricopeptide repeat protein [Cyanobacteria bacterium P01_A01_bin.123]